MNDNKKLVLFDFDLTITTKDTLFLFTKYCVGRYRYYLGMLWLTIPLGLHILKVISSHRIKEIFLTHFFSGIESKEFEFKCKQFASDILPDKIRQTALQEIKRYTEQGDRIIIVSASIEGWIRPWAEVYNLEVIATRLEIREGKVTGKIVGANCNGYEKVNRLKEEVDLNQYPIISAYGDSRGDLPMLELATQKYYKSFE